MIYKWYCSPNIVGGFIGFMILHWTERNTSIMASNTKGIMFGVISGLMIWTAWKELLPECRAHDKDDHYTTKLIFVGFLVMDLSLVLVDGM